MVDTVFFLLQFIGLGVLLHWAITHDKPDDSAAESGILAMRPAEPVSADEPRGRPGVMRGFRRSGRSGRDRRRSGSG